MKTRISVNLPSVAEITAGLDPEQDRGVLEAARRLRDAEEELERVRSQLREQSATVRALRESVPKGSASVSDLGDAIRSEQGAALLIPGAEQRVEEARESLEATRASAQEAVAAEGARRTAQLQAAADALAPALARIHQAEGALLDRLRAACSYHQRIGEQLVPVAAQDPPPVRWPQCRADENQHAGVRGLLRTSSLPGDPREHHLRYGVGGHQAQDRETA